MAKRVIKIKVDEELYWAWEKAKAELRARTNEEALIKLLKKAGFVQEINP